MEPKFVVLYHMPLTKPLTKPRTKFVGAKGGWGLRVVLSGKDA
jgi:hypothetical protein